VVQFLCHLEKICQRFLFTLNRGSVRFFLLRLVRDDDVLVDGIELDNFKLHPFFEIGIEIANRSDVDLRAGKEGFHPFEKLNDHTALDPTNNQSFNNFFVLVGVFYAVPTT